MENMIDIFNNKLFHTTSLTHAITEIDYKPGLLGEMGIFKKKSIRHRSFGVEKRAGVLKLIETSPLGAPLKEVVSDPRNLRTFNTTRLGEGFTIYGHELEGLRAFGKAAQLREVQKEWADRSATVKRNMELTREYHRLGAIQGKLLDSDGSSVIYDYFAEFGVTEPAAIDLVLSVETTNLRMKCHEIRRDMERTSKGAIPKGSEIAVLAGDELYDKLITHKQVERVYENQAVVNEFKENVAWQKFKFGGFTWINYRGTDDNSTVAVPVDQGIVFPANAPEVFQEILSPAEFFPWINTKGKREYMIPITDKDRQAWIKGELYSYPLFFCARPNTLRRITIS